MNILRIKAWAQDCFGGLGWDIYRLSLFPVFSTKLSCSTEQGWASQAMRRLVQIFQLFLSILDSLKHQTHFYLAISSFILQPQWVSNKTESMLQICLCFTPSKCQNHLLFLIRNLQRLMPEERIAGNPNLLSNKLKVKKPRVDNVLHNEIQTNLWCRKMDTDLGLRCWAQNLIWFLD